MTVTAASIPAGKDEATITINAAPKAPAGLKQTIIVSGVMNTGTKGNVARLLPAITVKIIAAK